MAAQKTAPTQTRFATRTAPAQPPPQSLQAQNAAAALGTVTDLAGSVSATLSAAARTLTEHLNALERALASETSAKAVLAAEADARIESLERAHASELAEQKLEAEVDIQAEKAEHKRTEDNLAKAEEKLRKVQAQLA